MSRKDGELTALKERLRSHAQAFDGLLSLIPAKYYYGEEDTSVCSPVTFYNLMALGLESDCVLASILRSEDLCLTIILIFRINGNAKNKPKNKHARRSGRS
jgi:hypothetical protein